MNSAVAKILAQVDHLSEEDLQIIKTAVTTKLQQKAEANTSTPTRRVVIPGAVRRSPQEIEAMLSRMFTPEERAAAALIDIRAIPPGSKTIMGYLNEDREDRF